MITHDILTEATELYNRGKKRECFLILNPILKDMQANGEEATGGLQELLERIVRDDTLENGVKE